MLLKQDVLYLHVTRVGLGGGFLKLCLCYLLICVQTPLNRHLLNLLCHSLKYLILHLWIYLMVGLSRALKLKFHVGSSLFS